MLPEFPRTEQAAFAVWKKVLFRAASNSNPLVSEVPIRVQEEGSRAFVGGSEIDYKKVTVTENYEREEGTGLPTERYFQAAINLGRKLADHQARDIFAAMSSEPSAGFAVDFSNEHTSFDWILGQIEKMDVRFDSDGNPKLPTFYGPPEVIELINKMTNPKNLTASQLTRFSEVIAQKRREYNERQAGRRLVE
jgi:hypothetical protein